MAVKNSIKNNMYIKGQDSQNEYGVTIRLYGQRRKREDERVRMLRMLKLARRGAASPAPVPIRLPQLSHVVLLGQQINYQELPRVGTAECPYYFHVAQFSPSTVKSTCWSDLHSSHRE